MREIKTNVKASLNIVDLAKKTEVIVEKRRLSMDNFIINRYN